MVIHVATPHMPHDEYSLPTSKSMKTGSGPKAMEYLGQRWSPSPVSAVFSQRFFLGGKGKGQMTNIRKDWQIHTNSRFNIMLVGSFNPFK